MSLCLTDYPNVYEQDTQFTDLDPLRHINNKAINTYYENARTRMLMQLFGGGLFFYDKSNELSAVLVEVTVRYVGEVQYPHSVVIGSAISRVGNSSFAVRQQLFQHGNECGSCDVSLVVISNGEPYRIPSPLRESMSQYLR